MQYVPNHVEGVILCGGLGTRFRAVREDTPKVLAPFGERVLLDFLIHEFTNAGIEKIILCVGHQKEKVREYVERVYPAHMILFSEETKPLGTGGAVKSALSKIGGNDFLVVNGDTIFREDLARFYQFHRGKDALATLALTTQVRKDGGSVVINPSSQIVDFKEKEWEGAQSFMSTGMYCMKKDIKEFMPEGDVFSLEYDLFPRLAQSGKCFGYEVSGTAHDIGTKERYEAGQEIALRGI